MNIIATLRRLKKKVDELSKSQGGGYTPPEGGVPKTDMASDVQASLAKADTAYQKSSNGIPTSDLASDVQSSLSKADTAYQKPSNGIPYDDMEGYKSHSGDFIAGDSLSPGIYKKYAISIHNGNGKALYSLYEHLGIEDWTICYILSIKGIDTKFIYTDMGYMFYTYGDEIIQINTSHNSSPAYYIQGRPIYKEAFHIMFNTNGSYYYIDVSNSSYSFDKTIISASLFNGTESSEVHLIKLTDGIYKVNSSHLNEQGISYCLCEFYKSDGGYGGYDYGYGY